MNVKKFNAATNTNLLKITIMALNIFIIYTYFEVYLDLKLMVSTEFFQFSCN